MPTYTYACKKCGHFFDVFHSISATPAINCEECESPKTERQLGTGAGIIFKGSGFYETDYKTKKGTPPASESKKSDTKKKSEPKGACASGSCGCAAAKN